MLKITFKENLPAGGDKRSTVTEQELDYILAEMLGAKNIINMLLDAGISITISKEETENSHE